MDNGAVAELSSFEDYVADFLVFEELNVIGRSYSGGQFVRNHACDGFCFADSLGFQSFLNGHVQEIGVAAEVELVCFIDDDSSVQAESYQVSV